MARENETVSTTIPSPLVKEIDKIAKSQHRDRAAWIRRAIYRAFLADHDNEDCVLTFCEAESEKSNR